jgi:GalNAc-alpha-(1->4)-GalNAc-alpha-(1->3)-diNAcBac-PP-undecaprenol alpha-1,4-N-acetyl-D-galactosaminyltransferase
VSGTDTPRAQRITCVISSLGAGGAERVLTALTAQWAAGGRAITVITLSGAEGDFFSLEARIQRIALNLQRPSRSTLDALCQAGRRISALRSAVRRAQPDVVLSFGDQTNVLTLLSTVGIRAPVVIAERSSPRHQVLGWPWEQLRRVLYPRARSLVAQTEGAAAHFRPWGLAPLVIPNAVAHPVGTVPAERGDVILGVGRMTTEKGFDLLLRAFARVADAFPAWTLRLVGDGPVRAELEALRGQLGLPVGRVVFAGRREDMEREYLRAAVFALPSRYEGFPNALCEAMAHGCAVVATRSPHGPEDIVRDEVDGLLVPTDDVAALSFALRRLMASERLRAALGTAAAALPDRLNAQRIAARWLQLLDVASA